METSTNGSGQLLDPNEANRRVNFVYRHLLEDFDPAVKKLVEAGAALFKALLSVGNAEKAYAEALGKVGETAKPCHSETKRIGFAIHELSDIFKKIQEQQDNLELWKLYHKGQKNIGKEMKRGSKNGMVTEGLQKQIQQLRNEGLRQALNEEKKRYLFVLDRHCAWMDEYMALQKHSMDLLIPKVGEWKDMCRGSMSHDEEPAAALALLDSAIQGEAASPRHTPLDTLSLDAEKIVSNGHLRPVSSDSRSTSISLSEVGDSQIPNGRPGTPPESALPAPHTVFYTNHSSKEEATTTHQQQTTVTTVETHTKTPHTPPPLKRDTDPEGRQSSLSQSSSSSASSSIQKAMDSKDRRTDSDSSSSRLPLTTELTVETSRIPSPPPPPPLPGTLIPAPIPPPEAPRNPIQTTPVSRRAEESRIQHSNSSDFLSVKETTAVYKAPQPASAAPLTSAMKSSASSGRTVSVQFADTLTIRSPASSLGDGDTLEGGEILIEGLTVEALFDYSAAMENQLTMKKGDVVRVIQEGRQGWVYGHNITENQRGWFPASYSKIREQQSPGVSPAGAPSTNGIPERRPEARPPPRLPTETDRVTQISPPREGDVAVVVRDKSRLHQTNYDTVPRNNPFAHVKLRPVVHENGELKKYS